MRKTLALLCLALALAPQPARAKDGPSTAAVHAAIERGATWLRQRYASGLEAETWHSTPELLVLTLSHAGVSPKDAVFARALELVETCELRYTYRVAVLAMALAQINPYKYRGRLAHCAQWLVDTQLPGGEWGYPGAVQGREDATRALKVEPPALPPEGEKERPAKAAPLVIVRQSDPASFEGTSGDFSNTQFALLGLRACLDARIQVPEATWRAALGYMERFQRHDGGWGYVVQDEQDQASYASLTAAGIVGVALCVNALGEGTPRAHPAVKKGLAWLAKRWQPGENVGVEESTIIGPSTWHTYHLYSIERVGRVLGLKKIGKHDWYAAGAQDLLGRQATDGSWEDPGGDTTGMRPPYLKTADTCFAILFLTLSTPPLTRGG